MNTQTDLLVLADEMASAASHFSSHGYDEFVTARERFVQANNDQKKVLADFRAHARDGMLPLAHSR